MFRKVGFARFSVAVLAFVASFNFSSHIEAAVNAGQRTRALITQEIDESRLLTLKGNTRPEANAVNDRGAVADDFQMEHMLLQLQRPPEQERRSRSSSINSTTLPRRTSTDGSARRNSGRSSVQRRKTSTRSPPGSSRTAFRSTWSIPAAC